jgi:tetratricopeptide (TPR) repeat protein
VLLLLAASGGPRREPFSGLSRAERIELSQCYVEAAEAYERVGKPEKARDLYRLSLRLAPEGPLSARARGALGVASAPELAKLVEEHLKAARRCFDLGFPDPWLAFVTETRFGSEMVEMPRRLEMVERGLAELEEVVRIDPRHAEAHNDIAWIRAIILGREPVECIRHAEKAVACATNDRDRAAFMDTLGWIHYKAFGNAHLAEELLAEALRLHPNAEIRSHLLEVRAVRGRK